MGLSGNVTKPMPVDTALLRTVAAASSEILWVLLAPIDVYTHTCYQGNTCHTVVLSKLF